MSKMMLYLLWGSGSGSASFFKKSFSLQSFGPTKNKLINSWMLDLGSNLELKKHKFCKKKNTFSIDYFDRLK